MYMDGLKVGAASLNLLPMDWKGNLAKIRSVIAEARTNGVELVCFPELSLPGYGCEDMFLAEFVAQRSLASLNELIPESSGIAISVGLPLNVEGRLYNAAAFIVDCKLLGFSCKHYLANNGVYYEPRWFAPWEVGKTQEIELFHSSYPVGDLIYNLGGVKIGFEICEDAWVENRFAGVLAAHGLNVILNPSASHFAFHKEETRLRLVSEGSKLCGSAYVYANLLGNDSGRLVYDGSRIIAQNGELLAHGHRLSYAEAELTTAVIKISTPLRGESGMREIASTFSFQGTMFTGSSEGALAPKLSKEEELYKAVSLGLHDYMRKSRSRGFVVSLSGGVDSAATACLAAAAIRDAATELGLDGLKARLSYWPEIQALTSVEEILRLAVTSVYQSTANSGEVTRKAASAVAEAIGSSFLEFDISSIVDSYLSLLKQDEKKAIYAGLPVELSWDKHDIPLQNIQARTRGPGVWLVANLRGALLLATSNRSEASVGYTTMDGDTCGGLSPIAGVDKAYLRNWLRWLETTGLRGGIPALSFVNIQEPTAELRPPGSFQTDEQDIMPYVVLDQIERLAVRDKQSPAEVLQKTAELFPEYPHEQILFWVKRFHRLWAINQWKRERYAPSFHLDDESVDPKTWCRFPILSSAYEEELSALK